MAKKYRRFSAAILAAMLVSICLTAARAADQSQPAASTPVLGVQKVGVILLNFADDTTPPYDKATANAGMDVANQFYQEASYGQFSLDWDVLGPFTLSGNKPCTYNDRTQTLLDAKTAIAAAGIDLAQYQNLIYAGNGCLSPSPVPGTGLLIFDGGGTMEPSRLVFYFSELLGVNWAESLYCYGVPYVPNETGCERIANGDHADVMGMGLHHFNAVYKERLGWLTPVTVTQSGIYEIAPIEEAGEAPKALKVAPATGNDSFYVEYRQRVGFDMLDTASPDYQGYFEGALIHLGTPQSALLYMDTFAQSADPLPAGTSRPALLPGVTYMDPLNRFSITTLSMSADSLRVQVVIPAAPDGPTLSFGHPLDGSVVNGAVAVSVNAASPSGINRVELYRDYLSLGTPTVMNSVYSFHWDTAQNGPGIHELEAIAYGNDGKTTTQTIHVTVHRLPTVTIGMSTSSVVAGETWPVAATILLDPNASLSALEFTIYGPSGAVTTSVPSPQLGGNQLNWTFPDVGSYTIIAHATDSAGFSNWSNGWNVTADVTAVYSNGVVNSADYHSPISPGALISIFGGGFTDVVTTAAQSPLPLQLGGVSATINGIAAPILYVSPSLINVQAPWALRISPSGSSQVAVVVNGKNGVIQVPFVSLVSSAPGMFRIPSQYRAIAMNPDGTLVAPVGLIPGVVTHPAKAGDTITILCTGLGAVTPSIADGTESSDQVRTAIATPTVTVGGIPATVTFAGLYSQGVGVDRLDVLVPAGVAPSDSVIVTVKGPANTDLALLAIGN